MNKEIKLEKDLKHISKLLPKNRIILKIKSFKVKSLIGMNSRII